MILALLLALVGYTSDQCNVCSWPYAGTANQRGECVLGVGLQSNVEGSCQLYCQTWGNAVAGQTSSIHVASSDASGTCVCQRTNNGNMEYISRPRKSCDKWGPSDAYINSQKTYGKETSFAGQYNINNYTGTGNFNSGITLPSKSYISLELSTGGTAVGQLPAMDGSQISDAIQTAINNLSDKQIKNLKATYVELSRQNDTNSVSIKNSIKALDSALAYNTAKIGGLASGMDMQANFDRLNYAINSRVGGGGTSSPTDLSPVLSAISSAQDANAASFASLGHQFTALGNDINSGLSAMSLKLDRVGDSVSSLGNHINYMGGKIDSGANARWKSDRAHADSLSSAAGDSGRKYRGISDSLAKGGGGGWGSDSLAAFNSGLAGTNNNMGLIQSEFASLKETLNSGSCDEFPSWGYDVWGHFYDIGAIFNQFPTIFSVMRFLGRFVGAFLGFKTIASALGAKKDS